ncbi:MAG: TIGR02285 family protein [Desulfobulbus sp.]
MVCYLFSLPCLSHASTKDSITWMEVNMPPSFIQKGPLKNQGYSDVIGNLIREHLTDYEHHRIVTNVVRHFDDFKSGKKVCGIDLYKTKEREAFMYFSLPCVLTLPPVLVVRKDKSDMFGTDTDVSLETILANEEFRLGLSSDRSYGQRLDALLQQHLERKNLTVFSGQELRQNYFKMLLLDRLDGLIALPCEAKYHAEQMGILDQISIVMLRESQQDPEAWMSSVACPKNAWGREVIDKINIVLIQLRPSAPYRQAYERWIGENRLRQYRSTYNDLFLPTRP